MHRRSDRRRRQRISTVLSALAAVLAVGLPTVVARTSATAPPAVSAAPSAADSVRLAAGYPAPTFPYTLPPTDGMKAPVASMVGQSNQTVGPYRAVLTHAAAGTTLDIDVTDWNATLEVTIGAGLTMSDADLLRFADGVHILNRSNPV